MKRDWRPDWSTIALAMAYILAMVVLAWLARTRLHTPMYPVPRVGHPYH